MKIKIISSLIILGLFVQCKKDTAKKGKQKIETISAINHNNFIGESSIKLQLFSDSSYVLTISHKDLDYEKLEKYKGFGYYKNDTIYFDRFGFTFNRSKMAVIKNNFVEFINGDFPLKIEIKKNAFKTKNKLDLKNYNDYAFFTFEPKFYARYFDYKNDTIKSYDLNQKELAEVDQILKKCFSDNSSKLRNIDKYVKQCIVITNDKHEKEVWISCYCKDFSIKNNYKYNLIMMNDGGNCNINLKINLTKHNYSDLNIAGQA